MAKEKVDAVVKRQCHARRVSLIKHHYKAKTNKGELNRAKVSRLREVPIFSYCPLRMERKNKDVFKIFQQTYKIVVVSKGPLISDALTQLRSHSLILQHHFFEEKNSQCGFRLSL